MNTYLKKAMMLSKGVKPEETDDEIVEDNNIRFKANNISTCPKCGNILKVVSLFSGNKAKYCDRHRITIPIPV